MQRRPIHRGGILAAGYDPYSRVLEIEFDTHRVLRYQGVGRAVAERFLSSASPLAHYREEIEEEYPCREAVAASAGTAAKPRKDIGDLKKLFGDR